MIAMHVIELLAATTVIFSVYVLIDLSFQLLSSLIKSRKFKKRRKEWKGE
jgi:hypothetical protein